MVCLQMTAQMVLMKEQLKQETLARIESQASHTHSMHTLHTMHTLLNYSISRSTGEGGAPPPAEQSATDSRAETDG